ncbi:hypothetical protein KAU33_08840 [Candidatus Dependentiae bacterium]|nr:hypothetical protein [Candidatus Dependentiae bacterium]
MENDWNDIKNELPIEVKWISWDNNGFGTLKEIKENGNELQFIVEHDDKRIGDMTFRTNPEYLIFKTYQQMFQVFSWSIQLLTEEKFWTETGLANISNFQKKDV